jgi:polar amino acid transport system substrate-binding protein
VRSKFILGIVLAASICGGFVVPALAEPIKVLITSRPPYYVVDDNGLVSGIVASPAVNIFKMAGLDIQWEAASFKRQLQMIEDNKEQICGIGWFKTPKREKFGKFTEYIYQNKPFIALIRSDNRAVAAHRSLRSLMSNQALKMGEKLGFSYGATVDELIDELAPNSITTDQTNVGMVRMLIGKRFDYMISSAEEAAHLIDLFSAGNIEITTLKFLDLPFENKRYILCSKSVGDEIIQRINSAVLKTRH